MLPSPSSGSPPKWAGESRKLRIRTLTTIERLSWWAPLRGATILMLGAPGGGSIRAGAPPPQPPASSGSAAPAMAAAMAVLRRIRSEP